MKCRQTTPLVQRGSPRRRMVRERSLGWKQITHRPDASRTRYLCPISVNMVGTATVMPSKRTGIESALVIRVVGGRWFGERRVAFIDGSLGINGLATSGLVESGLVYEDVRLEVGADYCV